MAGHFGIQWTLERLRASPYYWPQMKDKTRDVCKTFTSRPLWVKHLIRSSRQLVHDGTKSFGSIHTPQPVHNETKRFGSTPLPHALDAAPKKFKMAIYIKSTI